MRFNETIYFVMLESISKPPILNLAALEGITFKSFKGKGTSSENFLSGKIF
jgi:hypothetical protein